MTVNLDYLRRLKRWHLRPEAQDLNSAAPSQPWTSRTACCRSKKRWKLKTISLVKQFV